ncbi:MAG: prephenate dehydrogenase [Verrucomicrobiota bacterium]
MNNDFPFSSIAVIGPGLMGGSIALAVIENSRRQNLKDAPDIRVWGRNESSLSSIRTAQPELKTTTSLREAISGAELIIFCTPVKITSELLKKYSPYFEAGTLVTDVGSTKASVDEIASSQLDKNVLWCGSHPMAGSDSSGFSSASSTLYQDAVTVLTPTDKTQKEAIQKLETFWTFLGSKVITLSAEKHDQFAAEISHFPHLLAFLVMNCTQVDAFSMLGPGFRDFTRIAASPSQMWLEILSDNKQPVIKSIDQFIVALQEAKLYLEQGNLTALGKVLEKAAQSRRALKKHHVTT